jgi:2'-hydroxyisoflavone reductase
MRILVLGGTAFVGRHLVEAALAGGHEPVLFTRGQTSPGLFPEVDHVQGDREQDLGRLAGRGFDAVVDTSGYLPSVVAASSRALADAAGQYAFVSTISVYAEAARVNEDSPTRRPADPSSEDVGTEYGGLKTLCEEAVHREFPGKVLILRPGLIVGQYEKRPV